MDAFLVLLRLAFGAGLILFCFALLWFVRRHGGLS